MKAQRVLIVCGVMIIMTMVTGSASGQPEIAPGDFFKFPAPGGVVTADEVDGESDFFPFGIAVVPFPTFASDNLNTGVPLAGAVFASGALSRAITEVHQINEFTIPDPGNTGHALKAQISGSAFIGVFLGLLGTGQAGYSVTVEVIDVTNGEHHLVKSMTIDERQFKSELGVSASLSGAIQAGGIFAGGEASIGLGVSIPASMELVRATKDFGLDVLVQRGHTYQVMLKLEAEARNTLFGTYAIVAFPDVNDLLVGGFPSFFSPDTVIDLVDEIIPANELPNIPFVFGLGYFSPLTGNFIDSTNDLLDDIGIPTSLSGLADSIFAPVETELFLNPGERGVFLTQLSVLIQQDELEILENKLDTVVELILANAEAIENNRIVLCDVERLLHTPQGQRESDCENCSDQPGFPYDWPENNNSRQNQASDQGHPQGRPITALPPSRRVNSFSLTDFFRGLFR